MPPALAANGRLPEWPKGAVCKTVGSAYVGSNPTPATTCENGPLAGNSRLCGPFLLCPVACHLVALRGGVSRCPRTYSGRDSCPITVGAHRRLFHGRPRTGRAGGVFPGLTRGAESGVQVRPYTGFWRGTGAYWLGGREWDCQLTEPFTPQDCGEFLFQARRQSAVSVSKR